MAINLQKGQRIDLTKSTGATLTNFCVGVNWGGIEKIVETKSFFGLSRNTQAVTEKVDLDLSCVMVDAQHNMCDYLYSPLYKLELLQKFGLPKGKYLSNDYALKHSGDDTAGDDGGDDGLDNEVITIDLTKVNGQVSQIYFFLNNAGKEDFSQIPYAKIRMYEGTATHVKEVFASYNVAAEPQYKGKQSLIMGRLYRNNGSWKFNAIGDPTDDIFVAQTILRILKSYNK